MKNTSKKKLTIKEMQKIATSRGGKCLSIKYINNKTKLLWECEFGHQWMSSPNSIKSLKSWCPKCGKKTTGRKKLTIEEMQDIAKLRGGKCLSKKYISNKTKLLWECEFGHQWLSECHSIKDSQTWCPKCAGKEKSTIDMMKKIAIKKNGKCLSNEYKNQKTNLLWECELGHKWSAMPYNVKNGSWCPKCAYNEHKLGIEKMHELAAKKNGKCLSSEYIDSSKKLLWECVDGHQWKATPRNIGTGRWCPHCHSNITEEKCRYIIESITGFKFKKTRSILGGNLELDGYSKDLNCAFEYNGEQHYEELKDFFNKTKKDFDAIKFRDKKKNKICKEKNIKLFTIPYYEAKTNEQLIEFIYNKIFIFFGIKPILKIEDVNFNSFVGNKGMLSSLKEIAKNRGGECLSKKYVDLKTKILWRCSEGHEWWASLIIIKYNKCWCPACGGKKKLTIEEMKKIAVSRKGECVSEKYINSKTKLLWECEFGHQWWENPHSIRNNKNWCPECKKNKN